MDVNRQFQYLQLKYDPGTLPFLDTVDAVLKTVKRQGTENLTDRIIAALNRKKISLDKIGTADDLQRVFPISRICYDRANDQWFVDASGRIMTIEKLLGITPADIGSAAVQEFTERVNLRVETALDEMRFDRIFEWLDVYAVLRNDFEPLVDSARIDPLLFCITRSVKILAEIGNKGLIDDFRQRYVHIKFGGSACTGTSHRRLLSRSDNTFFDAQTDIAEVNRRIHGMCKAYEKNGGDIDETLEKIRRIRQGADLQRVIPALLNLRSNYLINAIKACDTPENIVSRDPRQIVSLFLELEALIRDDRVSATGQVVHRLMPVFLRMLEGIFFSAEYTLKDREDAFNKALSRVPQKGAYANLHLGNIYEQTLQAIHEMDREKMESHLALYRRIMETHFGIFKKSMAQIQRETEEIRRLYSHKEKLGLD